MRKGISLPIEMIVIIALAVIVLLAAGAFFISGTAGSSGTVVDNQAWDRACGTMKLRGCVEKDFTDNLKNLKVTGYDPLGTGQSGTFLDACKRALGSDYDAKKCFNNCCVVKAVTGTGGGTGTGTTDTSRPGSTSRR